MKVNKQKSILLKGVKLTFERMTLYEFNMLEKEDQHSAVWNYGTHICERIEGPHKLILYQIFSFYIELYYSFEDNRLTKLRSFSSLKCLDPYLAYIDITNLYF